MATTILAIHPSAHPLQGIREADSSVVGGVVGAAEIENMFLLILISILFKTALSASSSALGCKWLLQVKAPVIAGTTFIVWFERSTILIVNVYSGAGSRSVNVTVYCEVKLAIIGPSSDEGSTVEMINSCSGWYSVRPDKVMILLLVSVGWP